MPDEKRTFEVETYSAPALKLKPRRLKGRDGQANVRSGASAGVVSREDVQSSSAGFALSREIIMRLIEWLKEE